MSQDGLAARVSAEGKADELSWHQSTVARVESGTQPLRLDEAAVIARIFSVPLERLLLPSGVAEEVLRAEQAIAAVGRSWEAAAAAVAGLEAAIAFARRTGQELARSRSDRVLDAARSVAGAIAASTVRSAVAEGKARHMREPGS
jgi:hypothetical protein